jgi:hypothetical protein
MVRERSFEKPFIRGEPEQRERDSNCGELADRLAREIVFEEAIFLRRSSGDTIIIDAKVVGDAVP